MPTRDSLIHFDVLLKAEADGIPASPETIDRFKPKPEDIEKCARWFRQQAITVYPTAFGLACTATREQFESALKVTIEPAGTGDPGTAYTMAGSPDLPRDIAACIDQITLTPAPDFF